MIYRLHQPHYPRFRDWTPVDLEAGGIVWAIKRLRGYLWGTEFPSFRITRRLKAPAKWETTMRKSSIGSNFSSRSTTSSSPSRAAPTETPICWSRLPEPAKHDRSGSSSLTPVDDGGIFLIRACGFRTRSSPPPDVGLGGLLSRSENAVWGGLPFASSDFRDFCARGPLMKIDQLSVTPGDLSLVYLPLSPPSIAVPVAEQFCLPPTPLSIRFLP